MSEATIPAVSPLPGRLARLYGGLALYGTGIGLQVESGQGNGPWDVFHQGIAFWTGLSIGTVIIMVGALVMLAWIPLRQRPGLGTISNVIFVGLFADAAIHLVPAPAHPVLGWLYVALGVTSIALATVLYISAGMGAGPRDGVMTGLVRMGLSVRLSRFLIEITVLFAGWLLGGTAGLGTLAFALAVGPLTQLFSRWFPLK
ncbi:membrane protein YczE [Nonomuraea sp. LPB2021202275-12-8]|uniref:membrane protein YczE n=1 Tax=Nonomuraea sp. LPB2021202275-12-8 TaxID=3120159 RepID=UPI00300D1246